MKWVSPPERQGLLEQMRRLSIQVSVVAYEARPTGFGLARALRSAEIETLMEAPIRITRALSAGAKTDRLDCLRLADYAAKGMIRAIAIPTSQQEAQRLVGKRGDP